MYMRYNPYKHMTKEQLLEHKSKHSKILNEIEIRLDIYKRMERPFVAAIVTKTGGGEMAFQHEHEARHKLNEYHSRQHYRNEENYGTYLYRRNDDGTHTLLAKNPINDECFDKAFAWQYR